VKTTVGAAEPPEHDRCPLALCPFHVQASVTYPTAAAMPTVWAGPTYTTTGTNTIVGYEMWPAR
jgi:hypothetical protein